MWVWYCELNATRQVGMAANPISFAEIDAYCRMARVVMTPWELGLIRRIDAMALADAAEKRPGKPDRPKDTNPSTEPDDAKQRIRSAAGERRVVKRRARATEKG